MGFGFLKEENSRTGWMIWVRLKNFLKGHGGGWEKMKRIECDTGGMYQEEEACPAGQVEQAY